MESSFAPKLGNRGEIWRGDSRKPQVIGAPKTIFLMEFGAKQDKMPRTDGIGETFHEMSPI